MSAIHPKYPALDPAAADVLLRDEPEEDEEEDEDEEKDKDDDDGEGYSE